MNDQFKNLTQQLSDLSQIERKNPVKKLPLDALYTDLDQIVSTDPSKAEMFLRIITENIGRQDNSELDLQTAYKVLGKIRKNPLLKKQADDILYAGLKNPINTRATKKIIYRQLNLYDMLTSQVEIVKKNTTVVPKSEDIQYVDKIPADQPSLLFFGGTGTTSEEEVKANLSVIEEIMQTNNLLNCVNMYAIIYDFGDPEDKQIAFQHEFARRRLYYDYGDTTYQSNPEHLNEDTLHPKYIDQLFNKVFLPRICDDDGNRLSCKEACQRVRNLTICAHCHGAYTLLKIEELMQQKMEDLIYTDEERAKIQRELLCIAYASDVPLGVSKSTMISFISALDPVIQRNDNFTQGWRHLLVASKLLPSYFSREQGELFLVPQFYDTERIQKDHKTEHKFLQRKSLPNLTIPGQQILAFSTNAIVNGVRSSINKTPLPSVEDLVCGEDQQRKEIFQQYKQNGIDMWNLITEEATLNRIKSRYIQERE